MIRHGWSTFAIRALAPVAAPARGIDIRPGSLGEQTARFTRLDVTTSVTGLRHESRQQVAPMGCSFHACVSRSTSLTGITWVETLGKAWTMPAAILASSSGQLTPNRAAASPRDKRPTASRASPGSHTEAPRPRDEAQAGGRTAPFKRAVYPVGGTSRHRLPPPPGSESDPVGPTVAVLARMAAGGQNWTEAMGYPDPRQAISGAARSAKKKTRMAKCALCGGLAKGYLSWRRPRRGSRHDALRQDHRP